MYVCIYIYVYMNKPWEFSMNLPPSTPCSDPRADMVNCDIQGIGGRSRVPTAVVVLHNHAPPI